MTNLGALGSERGARRQRLSAWSARIIGWLRSADLPWVFLLFGLALALFGSPVPARTEFVYLTAAKAAYHPGYLAGDWTYDRIWWDHFVFNAVVGLPMLIASVPVVGWVGRLMTWGSLFLGLLRLARHFRIPPALGAVAVALWLATGQSVVGREWMVQTFEAKAVAYPLLVFGLDAVLRGRLRRAGVLLGLAFSVHPLVGLTGVFAAMIGALAGGWRPKDMALVAPWLLAGALPGIATIAPTLMASAADREGVWEFLVRVRMPWHLDVRTFAPEVVLLVGLLGAGVVVHGVRTRGEQAMRFWAGFSGAMLVVFGAGLAAGLAGWLKPLQAFPFRLPPVFLPLLFYFSVLRAVHLSEWRPLGRPWVLLVLGTVLLHPSPVTPAWLQFRATLRSWSGPDEYVQAFRWVRDHTTPDAVVLAPPGRADAAYWMERAQVATWWAVRTDRRTEWLTRMQALLGPIDRDGGGLTDAELQARYERLPEDAIEKVAITYGAEYVVSAPNYSFERVFTTGGTVVYRLPAVSKPSSGSPD